MKITKLLFTGLLLFIVTSLMSYGQSFSGFGTSDFMSLVAQYVDQSMLAAYNQAFAADQASASPSTPMGFLMNYSANHPEFSQSVLNASNQAATNLGITSDTALLQTMNDSIDKLKKDIDADPKLTAAQKQNFKDQLDQYKNNIAQMRSQIAATQTANANGGAGGSGTQPQENDMMKMLLPMLLMMLMGMCKGGGCGGK